MSKKIICLVSIAVLIFGLISCSNANDENSEKSETQSYNYSMGTGNVGGTWYPVGGAFAAAMSKADNVQITAQTAAGSTETMRMINNGDRDMGLVSTNFITWGEQGIEFFEGEETIDSIRVIATCMPQAFHYIVRSNSGIEKLTDFEGKRLGTGAPGSGESIFGPSIIEIAGLSKEDYTQDLISYSEQVTAFKDRIIDGMYLTTPAPSSAVMDVASQADITLINLSDELIEKILKAAPYYYRDLIKKESYDFLKEDVNTVGVMSAVVCHKDMPEDVVYEMTKALFENVEAIQGTHASVKDFTLETALVGNSGRVHPGAARYYEEMGIEIPEESK